MVCNFLAKNGKDLASLAQSARHSTVVQDTPGSSPLGLYSRHTTQSDASGLSGRTASPANLAASDIISTSRAKFDGETVLPDKPEAANCVM